MPHAVFAIDHSFATITRYVVKSVMEQLMFLTGIKDAEIIYNEPLGYGKNQAATQNPDAPALKLDSKDYFIVTYNERYDEQTIDPLANVVEHNAIFQHTELGVYLRPITCKANIEFTLKYRSKNYNNLVTWLARFQRNKIVREPHNYHDVLYNYTIPTVIGAYIYDVYMLTTYVEPYPGLTLKDFYKTHYCEGLMGRKNASGTKSALAINVNSRNNLGRYTSLPDEITTDKDKAYHEISFNYTLTYDKVVELLLEYQIFIHNQRIDNIYDQFFVREDRPVESTQGRTAWTGTIHSVTENRAWHHVEIEDIFIDPIDHWTPTMAPVSTSSMMLAPMMIDTNDLTLVENISNFPVDKFPQWIKDLMLQYHEYVTTPFHFPFTLTLYSVGKQTKIIPITMDNTGEIRSTSPLEIRKRHYLRLSLLTDLRRLPAEMLKRLCLQKDDLIDIIMAINPNYPVGDLRYTGAGANVQYESLWLLINNPNYLPFQSFSNQLFGYYTETLVGTTNIIVKKQE